MGSIQAATNEAGLSVSTVSHHLRSLENQMGVALLDHKRRLMTLTLVGNVFLKHVDEALKFIRKARSEVILGNTTEARYLRLGLIEDFDSDIGPKLAVFLSASMSKCYFMHHTRFSCEILDMLHHQKLDISMASRPNDGLGDLQEVSLMHNPFILALPANSINKPEDFLAGSVKLPLLRYAHEQQISRQIEN